MSIRLLTSESLLLSTTLIIVLNITRLDLLLTDSFKFTVKTLKRHLSQQYTLIH